MKIILVRHGKPENSQNHFVNSAGFANWVKNYNHSLVSKHSRPYDTNLEEFADFFIVSSDLPRAVDSSLISLGKTPDYQSKLFREMEIPRFKLPFTLKAWTWVYVNRLLWTLGKKGSFESYREARLRAKDAAEHLVDIAKDKRTVILFAHGYLILHMRKHLRNSGFKQLTKSNAYWGISSFET